MSSLQTIPVLYDGSALRPEGPVSLQVGKRYIITIEEAMDSITEINGPYILNALSDLAIPMGVSDLAKNHDIYSHRHMQVDQLTIQKFQLK
jgi:hypothetical protein